MKMTNLLFGLVAATLLVSAGCSKGDKTPAAPVMNGVTVDIPKLNAAFEESPQQIRSTVTQVGFNIRYNKYEEALMACDKLVNDPAVTEAQKKVVNEVIEEIKKLANAAPAAAPAQ